MNPREMLPLYSSTDTIRVGLAGNSQLAPSFIPIIPTLSPRSKEVSKTRTEIYNNAYTTIMNRIMEWGLIQCAIRSIDSTGKINDFAVSVSDRVQSFEKSEIKTKRESLTSSTPSDRKMQALAATKTRRLYMKVKPGNHEVTYQLHFDIFDQMSLFADQLMKDEGVSPKMMAKGEYLFVLVAMISPVDLNKTVVEFRVKESVQGGHNLCQYHNDQEVLLAAGEMLVDDESKISAIYNCSGSAYFEDAIDEFYRKGSQHKSDKLASIFKNVIGTDKKFAFDRFKKVIVDYFTINGVKFVPEEIVHCYKVPSDKPVIYSKAETNNFLFRIVDKNKRLRLTESQSEEIGSSIPLSLSDEDLAEKMREERMRTVNSFFGSYVTNTLKRSRSHTLPHTKSDVEILASLGGAPSPRTSPREDENESSIYEAVYHTPDDMVAIEVLQELQELQALADLSLSSPKSRMS